jgi:hypothetical protein
MLGLHPCVPLNPCDFNPACWTGVLLRGETRISPASNVESNSIYYAIHKAVRSWKMFHFNEFEMLYP